MSRGKQKRRRGNDGEEIAENVRVTRATAEDQQIAAFLQGGTFSKFPQQENQTLEQHI